MTAVVNTPLAMNAPSIAPMAPVAPQEVNPRMQRLLNRKRRMDFLDLANLLDSDGNLQNEMLVFAFAATLLSTVPVLLGNEFDVNVGLRKRSFKDSELPGEPEEESSYVSYAVDETTEPFFSASTYKKLMMAAPGLRDFYHIYNGFERSSGQESVVADTDMMELLRELLIWSHEKTKDKTLLPMLVNLAIDRYVGNTNPADKLVKAAYKRWRDFW